MNFSKLVIFTLYTLFVLHSMPMLGYRFPSVIWAIIVITFAIFLLSKLGLNRLLKIIPIFLVPLFDVFLYIDNPLSFLKAFSGFLQILILPLLALYLIQLKDKKFTSCFFILYVAIQVITCITTYFGCIMYPGASRELAAEYIRETPYFYIYLNANIGGFSFIYSMVLLSTLVICTIKNFKYINHKYLVLICSIIFLLLLVMVVIAAEYTTAIILLFITLLLIVTKNNFNPIRLILYTLFAISIVWLYKPFLGDILMVVSENINSEQVAHRITDVALSFQGQHTQNNSDLDARATLYTKSIDAFVDNPLGNWKISASGGHSFILDALAKFGLFGLLFVFMMIKSIYKLYILPLRGTFVYAYALFMMFLYILMTVLNPHAFTNIVLAILPIYIQLTINKENIKFKH